MTLFRGGPIYHPLNGVFFGEVQRKYWRLQSFAKLLKYPQDKQT
jgi:hypothetical protein